MKETSLINIPHNFSFINKNAVECHVVLYLRWWTRIKFYNLKWKILSFQFSRLEIWLEIQSYQGDVRRIPLKSSAHLIQILELFFSSCLLTPHSFFRIKSSLKPANVLSVLLQTHDIRMTSSCFCTKWKVTEWIKSHYQPTILWRANTQNIQRLKF